MLQDRPLWGRQLSCDRLLSPLWIVHLEIQNLILTRIEWSSNLFIDFCTQTICINNNTLLSIIQYYTICIIHVYELKYTQYAVINDYSITIEI